MRGDHRHPLYCLRATFVVVSYKKSHTTRDCCLFSVAGSFSPSPAPSVLSVLIRAALPLLLPLYSNCLSRHKTTRASVVAKRTDDASPTIEIMAASATPYDIPPTPSPSPPPSPPPHSGQQGQARRTRRVLWFNASHERDVVPLLAPLASARQPVPCRRKSRGNRRSGNNVDVDAGDGSNGNIDNDEEEADAPLFDEAWFMEVNPGRPSRLTPPTVQEILSPHGVSLVAVARGEGGALRHQEEGEEVKCDGTEAKAGAWQRTLQQVTFVVCHVQ